MPDDIPSLLPLQPTYRRSVTLGRLMSALAQAMAATGPAIHDSENPHFKSTYASLAACHAACIHPLLESGLVFTFLPEVTSQVVRVTGFLCHVESEEFLESSVTIPHEGDAHSIGSAMTYCKRYLYCMVGVVADVDDDGNAAVGRPAEPKPRETRRQPPAPAPKAEPAKAAARPPSVPPPEEEMSDETVNRIKFLFRELGYKSLRGTEKILAVCGVERESMRASHGAILLTALESEFAAQRKAS